MRISSILFPNQSRYFPGRRWLMIALRTAHLVGVAGLGGGYLYGAAPGLWVPYLQLTLYTGAGLMLLEIGSNGIWLIQLRGIAVTLKLGLLALTTVWLEQRLALFIAVILISGVVSHAPASVRYFSVLHWRRVEQL